MSQMSAFGGTEFSKQVTIVQKPKSSSVLNLNQ